MDKVFSRQKGPRAHHFVAGVSFLVGLTFLFESTTSIVTDAFAIFGEHGQNIWATVFLVCGFFTVVSFNIVMRIVALAVSSLVWFVFGSISLVGTWFGPRADTTTSYISIMAFSMVLVAILACSNVHRDFTPFRLTRRKKSV